MGEAVAIMGQAPVPLSDADLVDLRFRALLPEADWSALPAAVRRRFSKRLRHGATVVYRGEVAAVEAGAAGRLLAHLARLIGGPLPLVFQPGAAVVAVTEDAVGRGQTWSRMYVRAGGFPQVIHSAKRFAGPTGLEEHIGAGVGMALTVTVEDAALVFRSTFYFATLFRLRLRLPRWLEPGALTIVHRDLGAGRFAFTLALDHPLFGRLLGQDAIFRDAPAEET
ncbi:DUF4166 domain-containing protein [Roseibacterium beibuensis]|uniref:DUF4166 domain-containing protein n=1 Tax=[Roseibacterium] beibuensis TaxID=1193142 RepID=UPI00217D496C|nr:DUF4166 domain-containing protein [Roseibacterium beibuensis]MCS6622744.1 DUF4166 domain-containing protein [Roseibacterium beibuensis]